MKVKNFKILQTLQQSPQFELAQDTICTLNAAGHVAVLAGGCVRDALMGVVPYDLDIATSATPEQVSQLFSHTLLIGAHFGVVVRNAPLASGVSAQIEIASFRTDGLYVDGRRPETVTYATPEMDAERRDFTCNALFFDLAECCVWDFVDGVKDINEKTIRAVGRAEQRLNEDFLRSLRAVRFVSQLSFELDGELQSALSQQSQNLSQISMERKVDELYKMMRGTQPALAFEWLDRFHFWKGIHPQLHSVTTLWRDVDNQLSQDSRWIYFLVLQFFTKRLESSSKKATAEFLVQRMKVSQADSRLALQMFEICEKLAMDVEWAPVEVFRLKPLFSSIKRLATQIVHLAEHFHSPRSVCRSSQKRDAFFQMIEECQSFEPLISGNDLLKLGIEPGPLFRHWLDRAFHLQWEAQSENRKGAVGRANEVLDLIPLKKRILSELKKEISS